MTGRVLLVALCALATAPTAGAAELLYGVDAAGTIVRFTSDRPSSVRAVALSGIPADERVLGLDVRPADGRLYALTTGNRVYRIEPRTGVATVVRAEPLEVGVRGAAVGFDVNPATDRIRFETEAGQNLRVHPDTGAVARRGGQLDIDGSPAYESGDSGSGSTPRITAVAHTNNVHGATATDVLAVDVARDVLAVQHLPNRGVLRTRGALGVDASDDVGFDIAADGSAYAAIRLEGEPSSRLYRLDVATGAVTLVGTIGRGSPIVGLAALGTAPAPLSLRADVLPRSPRVAQVASRGLRVRVTCTRACAVDALLRAARIVIGRARSTTFRGVTTITIHLTRRGRAALVRRRPALTLTVSARTRDGDSARARTTVQIRG